MHGFGLEFWEDGTQFYSFTTNNARNGVGFAIFMDDSIYSGQWKDNDRHGYGMFKFGQGGIFYGHWTHQKANGEGAFVDENGLTVVEGNFVNGWTQIDGNYSKISFQGVFFIILDNLMKEIFKMDFLTAKA